MMKPGCYECKHRGNTIGSHHSCCNHPANAKILANPLAQLLGAMHSSSRTGPISGDLTPLKVKGNAHGIRSGWFMWPINFDPVWLEECDGFEEKAPECKCAKNMSVPIINADCPIHGSKARNGEGE